MESRWASNEAHTGRRGKGVCVKGQILLPLCTRKEAHACFAKNHTPKILLRREQHEVNATETAGPLTERKSWPCRWAVQEPAFAACRSHLSSHVSTSFEREGLVVHAGLLPGHFAVCCYAS